MIKTIIQFLASASTGLPFKHGRVFSGKKSNFSSVQGTRKTPPCLTGHPVCENMDSGVNNKKSVT